MSSDPTTDYAANLNTIRRALDNGSDAAKRDAHAALDAVERMLASDRRRVASLEAERNEAREECVAVVNASEALINEAEARAVRAETALRGVKLWFDTRPWEGTPDGSAHGGGTRDYSESERKLGYGTYRDPRHLPAALAVSSASKAETEPYESFAAGQGANLDAPYEGEAGGSGE